MVEIINSELINLSILSLTKEQVISEMAKLINQDNRLIDLEGYILDVKDRENSATTGIGFGIAIPHAKSQYVKETTIAFGRTSTGIEWNSIDGELVDMIFLLAVPEKKQGDEHLRLLSSLSRKLIHEEFRNNLRSAITEDDVVEIIRNVLN